MSYWTDRQERLKQTAEKDEAKLKKRLSSFYDAEFKRLEKEIAAYYQQYGEDNVIAYRNLLQSLSEEDRALLMERMDDFAAKYPQYAELMPVRESIYRLDRLQGLQYSVFMTEAEIAGFTDEQMKPYLVKIAAKGINYGMETLGFGKNFYSMNSDVVKQFVGVPWCNGEDFSTRIWNDTQKLAQYLSTDIAQGFARGDSYDKLVRQLRQRFDRVNRKDAYRLVYTEGTYVMAESTMQPFKDDFEKYRLSPVLDGRTCPICRGVREQVFLISERQPGVNFPPLHPWCRCTFEIVVDDWGAWMDEYVSKNSGDRSRAEEIAKRIDDSENAVLNREYKELSLEEFKKMHHTVTKEERRIIYGKGHFSGYVNSSNARKINGLLRKGEPLSPEYQKIVDSLSSVIQKNEIEQDIIVTRYVTVDALEDITGTAFPKTPGLLSGRSEVEKYWQDIGSLGGQIQKGHTYTEKGFLSTSGVLDKNVMQDKGVLLRIKVPKGKNGYVTTNYKESEIIFDRGARLEILDAHVENNRTYNVKVVLDCVMR